MNTSQIPLIILNTAGSMCWVAVILRYRDNPAIILFAMLGFTLSFGGLILAVMKARGDIQ